MCSEYMWHSYKDGVRQPAIPESKLADLLESGWRLERDDIDSEIGVAARVLRGPSGVPVTYYRHLPAKP